LEPGGATFFSASPATPIGLTSTIRAPADALLLLVIVAVDTVAVVIRKPFASTPCGRFTLFALPPLLYAAAIISVSSIPDLSGPELPVIPFDKTAHILEYCGFGLLTIRGAAHFLHKFSARLLYLFSLTVVAGLGAFDEWYQSFVPGRSSDIRDFLADFAGGLLAIGIFALWQRRFRAH